MNLIPFALSALRSHWRLIAVGVLILALAVQTWRLDHAKGDLKIARALIEGMEAQARAMDALWRTKENQWAKQAKAITKDRDNEIADIRADAARLRSELRSRPSRPPASTPESPADGKAFRGCDGTKLYREDAGFLVGEAERADTIRAALRACYRQYELVGDE